MLKRIITSKFNSHLLRRYDPDGSIFYFSPEDLGAAYTPFDFAGDSGQRLQGYFYTKGETMADTLVIFDHGMGCGHRAYMREISVICEHGYEVFSYDHTGTRESEGEHIGGFSQSLSDLDHAISALKASGRARGKRIVVIGHSWGGFSTMNIPAYHPDITHVVALSGFISPCEMISSVLGKLARYTPVLLAAEKERFGAYAEADARISLKLAADTRALIIHSDDDKTCPITHLEKLREAIGEDKNVTFLSVGGKNHNPNFTGDAVAYKDGFFAELTRLTKKKKLSTPQARAEFVARWDWWRMTEQDMELWDAIFKFIEG